MTVAELAAVLAVLPPASPVLMGAGRRRHGRDAAVSVVVVRRMLHTRGHWWADELPEGPAASLELDAGPALVGLVLE